ncbi:phosphate transporter [Scenedesmus sp. NREL 46B-D3]|nr:phosphate transporter [Scenedesmus sp. NREL 46B-D3]
MYEAITWMFAVGFVLALLVAYGLGANDVANMFGPSVGARALTMRQALLVAAVFEFLGAVLMGAGVADTIRSGITNIDYFTPRPDILAYGMMCALGGTGTWMMAATYWELPVSSTQAIIASVAGMSIVAKGWNAVVWTATTSKFPYMTGMSFIALSWLVAPVLAGIASCFLYFVIRTFVLRAKNAYQRSLYVLPVLTFVTFFTVTWFTMVKGGIQYNWSKIPDVKKAWISIIVASGTTLLSIYPGLKLLKRNVQQDIDAEEAKASSVTVNVGGDADKSVDVEGAAPPTPGVLGSVQRSRVWQALTYGLNYDIHKVIETDERVAEIHANAEVFDRKAELSFKYLQVCTACANAFAHGSNEVANAVGPLSAIYQVWQTGQITSKAPVPTWLLAIGALGICVGLATFGYTVMRAMGVKMTRLTNSRGFCVELCVAAVVIVASYCNLPMSSTLATVGAIAGVGLWEGRSGFNAWLFVKMVSGWILTIIASVSLTCLFMAQGLYAPSRGCALADY